MATIYIDPTVGGAGTGTIGDPFQDWSSVTWTAGNSYLQKRGTTYRKTITIGANNVTIGAYGTGDQPIIRADQSFTPTWTAQANGEYSCPAPANSFGSSSLVAMFIKNGNPVTKRGTIGSLTAGECQSTGTTIYYKPVNGDHTTASFAMLYQDYGFTVNSAVVRDNVTIEDFALMYVYIGFYTGNAGAVEAATNWTPKRVRTDWTPRGGIHFCRGGPILVEDSVFSKFASTGVNFGLGGTSGCGPITFRRNTVEEGVAWISDTNLEGHAFDMVELASGLYIADCKFLNHGASYPLTTYYGASGAPYHRMDATLSFDGVSDVTVTGCLFENNSLAPIQCGSIPGYPGNNQRISGNVFKGNLKKFTASDTSGATQFTCVEIFRSEFANMRIENNTFVDNGNGFRLTPEHQRPCIIYAVTTTNGAVYDLKVKNNIFGRNNVSSLLVIRIVAASGTITGANISNNVYELQTDAQWSDVGLVTNYIYVEPATVSYQVPASHTFSAYRSATSADTGSLYQVSAQLRDDFMPMSSAVRTAGTSLGGGDYYGNEFKYAPTIGAVQYEAAKTVATRTIATRTTTTRTVASKRKATA